MRPPADHIGRSRAESTAAMFSTSDRSYPWTRRISSARCCAHVTETPREREGLGEEAPVGVDEAQHGRDGNPRIVQASLIACIWRSIPSTVLDRSRQPTNRRRSVRNQPPTFRRSTLPDQCLESTIHTPRRPPRPAGRCRRCSEGCVCREGRSPGRRRPVGDVRRRGVHWPRPSASWWPTAGRR